MAADGFEASQELDRSGRGLDQCGEGHPRSCSVFRDGSNTPTFDQIACKHTVQRQQCRLDSSVVHDGRAVRSRPESITKHLATRKELFPRTRLWLACGLRTSPTGISTQCCKFFFPWRAMSIRTLGTARANAAVQRRPAQRAVHCNRFLSCRCMDGEYGSASNCLKALLLRLMLRLTLSCFFESGADKWACNSRWHSRTASQQVASVQCQQS